MGSVCCVSSTAFAVLKIPAPKNSEIEFVAADVEVA